MRQIIIIGTAILSFVYFSVFSQNISAGYYHTIILCEDSTLKLAGTGANGELAVDTNYLSLFNSIVGLDKIVAVSAGGNHTLALTSEGKVYSWGMNKQGQLGDSTTINRSQPELINGLSNIVAIESGESFSFAIRNDGKVYAWGNNSSGQLGLGHKFPTHQPILNPNLSNIKKIAGGQTHSLALTNNGRVYSFGNNIRNQLGDGTTISSPTPILVPVINDIIDVAAGFFHSVAVKENGNVYSWGYNAFGSLGIGNLTSIATPVQVSGLSNAVSIEAGQYHTVARTELNEVYTWGINYYGQIGNGSGQNQLSPTQVNTGAEFVYAGIYHSGSIDSLSANYAWGLNSNYQAGQGNTSNNYNPTSGSFGCAIAKVEPACFTQANFYPSTTNVCVGSEIVFTNMSQNSYAYNWLVNGVSESQQSNLTRLFTASGLYEVALVANPNGCSDTIKLSVQVDEIPTVTMFTQGLLCVEQDSVALNAVGSSGTWSGTGVSGINFNPSIAGVGQHELIYNMINGACTSKDTLSVNVSASPITSFATTGNNDTIQFTNNSQNATNYQWYFGDGASTTETNPEHVYIEDGTYHVLLISENNCGITTSQQTVIISATGLKENAISQTVVYPIPAKDKITIQTNGVVYPINYSIWNNLGQQVSYGSLQKNIEEINLSNIPTGSYVVKIGNKEVSMHPIIVAK